MKYQGRLKQPVVRRQLGILALASDEAVREAAKAEAAEITAKLPELFAHYGIELGDWPRLALALAREHVPGFKVVAPAGRKTEWSAVDRAELRLDVDNIAARASLPTTEAMKLACREPRWATKTKKMSMAAIAKQYYSADDRWVAIVKDARAYESMVRVD